MWHIYMHICIYIYVYIYIMGYYSYLKNEILPFVTTWMDLEGIMLSKMSQIEKDKHSVILFTYRIF